MSQNHRSASLSLGLRAILRRLASQPALVFSIFVAIGLGAFLMAAVPRTLEVVAADDLEATVSVPPAGQKNIRVETQTRLGAGPEDDPMERIRAAGDDFTSQAMPLSVQEIIADRYFVMDTVQFVVSSLPGEDPPHPFDMFLQFRYQEGIEDRTTLIEGAMPRVREPITMLIGHECPQDVEEREETFERLEAGEEVEGPEGDPIVCAIEDVPHYEVAVTRQTLTDMGLGVGRQMLLRPDPTDRLTFGLSADTLDINVVMSISGVIDLTDRTEEYWYGDPSLHEPRIQENADLRIIFAKGLITPDAYRTMVRDFGLIDRLYTYRYLVGPELVAEADLEVLNADLRTFTQQFTSVAADPSRPRVLTQLPDLLDTHVEQREQTFAMVSTGLSGLFAVVVAVVLILALLMAERQRSGTTLMRGRGAAAGQLTLTSLYEALLMIVPAAVLSYFLAEWLLPDTDYLFPYRATVALVAGGTAAIVGAAQPMLRRRLGVLLRSGRSSVPSGSGRRLVLEILVMAVAVGSIVLLRRRGESDQPAAVEGFDWLTALAPTLLAVAVGLITIRLYPFVVRGLAWIAAKMRGLVGFVGFRRVLQQPLSARLPVLVIVLCVSVAAFSAVVSTTVGRGQEVSSWQAVGADYSLKGNGPHAVLLPSLDLGAVPADVRAEATTFGNAEAQIEFGAADTQAMAIDTVSYAAVTEGTIGDVMFPGRLIQVSPSDVGSPERPIPAIVASVWPRDFRLSVGDTFTLDMGRLQPTMVVVEIRDRFPDLDTGRPFVVFNLEAIRMFSDLPVAATRAYLRGPETIGPAIEASVNEMAMGTRFSSRYEALAAFADDPFVSWVSTGQMVVFLFSVAFAAVAAVSSLALASATRRRDFAYLRTMGLTTRQATAMTVIEQFPAVVIATLVGAATGVATATILDPAIDFDSFTGDLVPTSIYVSWPVVIGGVVALIAALGAAVVIFVLASKGDELGQALKVGEE